MHLLTLHVPRTDLWIGLIRPSYPSPFPFLLTPFPPFSYSSLPLSNYLLVSSPAGRSFFEKTTRARTTPTSQSQKLRSLPHPDRRHSSTFVSISPLLFHPTRSPSTGCAPLLFPLKSLPPLLLAWPPLSLLPTLTPFSHPLFA